MLPEQYIIDAEHRARRFSGAYTGTSGTLAADVILLAREVRRLKVELARQQEIMVPNWLARPQAT